MTNHRPGEIDATKCGVGYCEHHREGLPVCVECREESTLAHDKACAQLDEARAEIETLKRVNVALNEEIKIQRAYVTGRDNTIERKDKLIEQMREALRLALPEARSTHVEQTILAALAAEGGG